MKVSQQFIIFHLVTLDWRQVKEGLGARKRTSSRMEQVIVSSHCVWTELENSSPVSQRTESISTVLTNQQLLFRGSSNNRYLS